MHDLNSLVKLNVLLFKLRVKKRRNGRREDSEDPVICVTDNLKTTSSRAKIIVIFDLKSSSNKKTQNPHMLFRMRCCIYPN